MEKIFSPVRALEKPSLYLFLQTSTHSSGFDKYLEDRMI